MMKLLKGSTGLAALYLLGSGLALQGAITCTTADYRGTYAFYTTGALLQLPPAAAALIGPFAQAGIFNSDGAGNVVIESAQSYGGYIQSSGEVGTYSVSPDCVVTYSLVLPPPLSIPATFTSVLSGGNRQNVVMITEPQGSVVVGRHVKQDQRFCAVSDFTGAYQIDIAGTITGPKEAAGLFQGLGRLVSDGNGNFTGKSIGNFAGRQVTEDFKGTYDVTAKCGLTLKYANSFGQSASIGGYLGGHGDSAAVIVLNPGWAVSGMLRAQQ